MKVIDLTHTIQEEMPVFPGTEPPALMQAASCEENGFREMLLKLTTHTGTHMDCSYFSGWDHIGSISGRSVYGESPCD